MKKLFLPLVLFWLAFCASPAHAAFINGQNYVPLADWARGNGFYGFTRDHGQEIILTNRAARLVFDVDSAQAEINGVNVRLSFPVANQKGVSLISQLDLDKTIRPLLFPSRYVEPKKITTICLDPGHGGKDSGNRVGFGFFGHSEKTYTLLLAFELRDQLKKLGFRVVLTRNSDTFVDLPVRPAIANRNGADLFISLHFNAAQTGKDEVEGPETYCITPVGAASSNAQGDGGDHGATTANRFENKSLLFAYQMEKSLVQNLNVNDRSARRARFAVLRDAAMPAILIEGGYMTNPTEGKKIYDAAYRKQMAAAIVKGILAYQKLTAPAAPVPKTNPPGSNKISRTKNMN
ncbi:MAG TPA: N-acetylmuramoyl-L-alanine amidase [Verrucomicrobiae bacterium]|nr:N-acetylmuramoyl-L-alanine amidase [Verrucomicrobiae bacterium]